MNARPSRNSYVRCRRWARRYDRFILDLICPKGSSRHQRTVRAERYERRSILIKAIQYSAAGTTCSQTGLDGSRHRPPGLSLGDVQAEQLRALPQRLAVKSADARETKRSATSIIFEIVARTAAKSAWRADFSRLKDRPLCSETFGKVSRGLGTPESV
jgi:hypothetical protein